ncbi:hypothetical protein [Cupriavidus campinensis]|uniref:Uncharacterized protein n=1 Tax=Cupriavidus campinensis TaxID=151783 RepID=A0ABY3ESP2_9BURK|nr:hypothetical protein [Cupriavidus campinensis]TSP13982.1 hypothetical protein FGG12_05795 [Cupriavidus campinensis]
MANFTTIPEEVALQLMELPMLRPIFQKISEMVPGLTTEERMKVAAEAFQVMSKRIEAEREARQLLQARNLLCGALRGVVVKKEVEDQYPAWGSW